MKQSQALQENLSQHLAMTMKMQQAIKILQLSAQDLRGVIEKEYLENPALEIDYDRAVSFAETGKSEQVYRAEDISAFAAYLGGSGRGDEAGAAEEEKNPVLARPASRTLEEELMEQAAFAYPAGRERERAVAVFLIGSLDGSGYLRVPLAEAARATQVSGAEAEAVLAVLQSFEPAGVGARDLAECLRLQAVRRGIYEGLVAHLIDRHLDAIAAGKIKEIAAAEGARPADVQFAVDIIRTLSPKPGAAYGAETPGYITPDVIVRRQGSGYHVELNDEGVPQLRISKLYQHAEGLDSETQAYISGRFRAALWLIKSIESRRTTIRRVVGEIVRRQRACIEQGPAALVPMTMQEVADAIGVHESTVSRAAAGKYVELPRGIVPMKSFFTANLAAGGAAAYSAVQVKRELAALIEGENPAKPLSDAKLAKLLEERGCAVSRRTVVKYREQLGYASSVKRKRY
ncbi:RNA polymerase factor sigma-54 [Selenomonas sp.]|jgi:RNA polymerase sigma-54 factor|uniref:RNA polymerase factor sigma-54 n=1 Tax=Selenomonas sp. TaxID=2053611 RepID=UPI003A0FE8EC